MKYIDIKHCGECPFVDREEYCNLYHMLNKNGISLYIETEYKENTLHEECPLRNEHFDFTCAKSNYDMWCNDASELINQKNPDPERLEEMNNFLVSKLDPKDDFLFRWRVLYKNKMNND